jgi:hypothetical protein
MFVTHKTMRSTIEFDLMRHYAEPSATAAELSYQTRDPLVIQLSFDVPDDGLTTLLIGRELLAAGMHSYAGEGVIRVSAAGGGVVLVDIGNDLRELMCTFPADPLAEFVQATYDLVPASDEAELLDIDSALGKLFARDPK